MYFCCLTVVALFIGRKNCFSITEGYTQPELNGSPSSRHTLTDTRRRKSHAAMFPVTNGTLPPFFLFFFFWFSLSVRQLQNTVYYEDADAGGKKANLQTLLEIQKKKKKRSQSRRLEDSEEIWESYSWESYLTKSHPRLSSNKITT